MNSSKFFRLCHNCNKEGVNHSKCSKCKIAFYCCKECQMNNWFKHKYICNLTKESHSVLTNELNFVVTNVKFICLLQSLVYHFFSKNDDEFLMCIISKDFGDNNESCYRCSFLIHDIDGLITKNLTKESKILWLVFKNDENDISEGGFRFNLKECKNYYDEIKQFVNF